MKQLILYILFFAFASLGYSQSGDTTRSNWNYAVSADIVSRYVWRGTDYGNSPAFQPDLEVSYKNFTLGGWGSAAFTSYNIQETDLFFSYKIWKLKFTCWDYFYLNTNSVRNNYFEYSNNKTGHDFSFDTEFRWSENFPLRILASYNFYGADTLHSSYFEISYSCHKKIPLVFSVGYTPDKGWYGNGPGFVNIGVGLEKECVISEKISIPVYCKLVMNPQRENIHLVAGITF